MSGNEDDPRTRHDDEAQQLALDAIATALDTLGTTRRPRARSSRPTPFAIRFTPKRVDFHKRLALGMLGDLAATPCLIVLQQGHPEIHEIRGYLADHLMLQEDLVRIARRRGTNEFHASNCRTWIITSEYPDLARAFGLEPCSEIVTGVYRVGRSIHELGIDVRVVVTNQLQVMRHTLFVRLLAGGQAFANAVRELDLLPANAWERPLARPLVDWFERAAEKSRRRPRDPLEQEFLMVMRQHFK